MARTTLSYHCSFEDRFIPRRSRQDSHYFNINLSGDQRFEMSSDERRYVNRGIRIVQKDMFQQRLFEVLGPRSNKVLNFSEFSAKTNFDTRINFERNWPVKPRKNPCIKFPQYDLDMPDLQMNLCHNIIDWCSNGEIVAIVDNTAYFWQPGRKSEPLQGEIKGNIGTCLKFNPSGTRLFVSLLTGGFAIVEMNSRKVSPHYCYCKITSIEWLNDDIMVLGTDKGYLMPSKREQIDSKMFKAHKGPVTLLKKSCKGRYLATLGLDKLFTVWTLADFKMAFEIKLFSPVKALAWHPWDEPVIVTPTGKKNNNLTVWNMNKLQETNIPPSDSNCYDDLTTDALNFNKLSGELVVSFYNNSSLKCYIVVLASFTKRTEVIEWHTGRVPYLIWSGDHKQLLTAGTDESIGIWEFFEKREKLEKKSKMLAKTPLSLFCLR